MNNIIKSIVISVVSAIVIVLVGFGIYHPKTTVIQNSAPQQPVRGTSPEISSPYISVNGVINWQSRVPLAAGTSTPCQVQSPAATSSLEYFYVLAQSTSTASVWTLATSTTPNATTTAFYNIAVASGASVNLTWYPSTPSVPTQVQAATSTGTLLPNTWVTIGTAGGLSGPAGSNALYASTTQYVPNSYCTASFIQL